jgi:hypothetical protein
VKNFLVSDLIRVVQKALPEAEWRIADTPAPFRAAFWPNNPWNKDAANIQKQLFSDYGMTAEPEQLSIDFYQELDVIQKCLDAMGNEPGLVEWQKPSRRATRERPEAADAAEKMYKSMNQRAAALNLWGQIAIPFRRRGDLIYRIFAPRDVLGSPVVEAMRVDEFIRDLSLQSARDRTQLARLGQQMRRWRYIAAAASIIAVLLALPR